MQIQQTQRFLEDNDEVPDSVHRSHCLEVLTARPLFNNWDSRGISVIFNLPSWLILNLFNQKFPEVLQHSKKRQQKGRSWGGLGHQWTDCSQYKSKLTRVNTINSWNLQVSKRQKVSASEELFNFPVISAGLMRGEKTRTLPMFAGGCHDWQCGLVSLSLSRWIILYLLLLLDGKTWDYVFLAFRAFTSNQIE